MLAGNTKPYAICFSSVLLLSDFGTELKLGFIAKRIIFDAVPQSKYESVLNSKCIHKDIHMQNCTPKCKIDVAVELEIQ
jgi:hypothetical protein